MSEKLSARRMAENEVVFRQFNEKIQKGFEELNDLAATTGQAEHAYAGDDALHFYCECSDENCRLRVKLKPSRYADIHKRRDHFVIVAGHETPAIERVIDRDPAYWIVEKFETPPETATELNETDAKNV